MESFSFDIENATEIKAEDLLKKEELKAPTTTEPIIEGAEKSEQVEANTNDEESSKESEEEVEGFSEIELNTLEAHLEASIENETDAKKKAIKKKELKVLKEKKGKKPKYNYVRELKFVNPESIKFWNRGELYTLIYYNYSRRDQHMENVLDRNLLTIKYKGDQQAASSYIKAQLEKMKYIQNEAIDKKMFLNMKIDQYSELVDISFEKPDDSFIKEFKEYKSFQNKLDREGKKVVLLEDKVAHLMKANQLHQEEKKKQNDLIDTLKNKIKELEEKLNTKKKK